MSCKTFVANSVGCESTASEGSRVIDYLKLNGHSVLDRPEQAEYIIVNTCAFVDVQRRQVIERLQSLSDAAPSAKLIIMGCAGDIAPDCLEPYNIDMVLGHYDLDRLDDIFALNVKFNETPTFAKHLTLPNIVIVAARGCVGTCSYCSIKRSTGKVKSRPVDDLLADIRQAMEQGDREFFITGDDLGSYGLDIGETLPSLLNALRDSKLDIKVLLGNINPRWINEYIEDLVAFFESDIASKWIFFPVQSANNEVLEAMGRQYTIEECIESIKMLQSIQAMKFYYDFIVGFPTETEEAFMETCQFVLDYPPSHGMVASFSPEEGTPAYDLTPLPEKVVKERHKRLAMVYSAAQNVLSMQNPNLVRIFGT